MAGSAEHDIVTFSPSAPASACVFQHPSGTPYKIPSLTLMLR